MRGNTADARHWFELGLRYEPYWSLLHEDRGRALLAGDPASALAEFEQSDCGAPCTAEQGDALAALGKPEAAVDRYLDAKAISRVADRARALAARGNFEAALALERELIHHLHDSFMEQADLASSYATLGEIESSAARSRPHEARAHVKQSAAAFGAATKLAPFNEGYLLSFAFAQLELGDVAAARRALRRLLELHPHQADAEAALARIDRQAKPTALP